MSNDPWAAFPVVQPAAPAAAPPQPAAADPWAAFPVVQQQTQADGAPLGLVNKPTDRSDPIYHGAVPIAQAPDQGATTAFASGVGGVPIAGPAILGGVERAAALARSATGGGSYDAELQHVREIDTIARQQHPGAAFAGDLTGASAALAPVIGAAPAAFGAGPGGLTAGKVGMGALSGAGIGGADAGVRTGGDIDAMGRGVATGAAFGAAGPMIGAIAARAGQGAAALAGRVLAPNPGMSRPAADIITRGLVNDGATAGQGAANLAAAGPRAMLADASPSLSGALDTALQHGGPGAAAARQAIEARAAAASGDLSGALDTAFGPAQGIQTATNEIRNGTAAARQQAYDAAYNSPIDYTTDHGRALEEMIASRVPPGIIARANNQMRVDGMSPTQQVMARVMPDGGVVYEQMPDVRQVDYITRSLQDVSRAGDGQGALGGNTAEGRSYGVLAREIRDRLRQAVPEYATALDTAAAPIQARNALDFGAEMLAPHVARDVAADTISGMTRPELDQVRQGVRSRISDMMANVGRTISDPNTDAREAMATVKALSSRAAQDKLGLVLDAQTNASLQRSIAEATRALELRGSISRNSATYGRMAGGEVAKQAAQPGMLSRILIDAGPFKSWKPVMEAVTGNRPADIAARQSAIQGEVARVLTSPQGAGAGGVLDQLLRGHAARERAGSIADAIPFGSLSQTALLALLPAMQGRLE